MCNAQIRVEIDKKVDNEIKKAALNRRALTDFEDIVGYFLKNDVSGHSYFIEGSSLNVKVETFDIKKLEDSIKNNRPGLIVSDIKKVGENEYVLSLTHEESEYS